MTAPNEFLALLWGEDFDVEYPDHRIVLWTMPGKKTYLYTSPLPAGDASNVLSSNLDVYCGVCCVGKDHDPSTGRGTKDQMTLACGLWADIDFGPGHEKNVPPSLEAAMGLLAKAPIPPTVLVHSGHGLHSWWILKAPEALQDFPARARLERACKGWQRIIADAAHEQGWEIDSTADCTRVLRVAGTFNRKNARDIMPVRVISSDGPRTTSIEDFLFYVPADDSKTVIETISSSFTLDPKAFPDPDKLESIRTNDNKFRHTLEHKRRGFDTSCSGYEQSLASQAVAYGWNDQEIANLIISHRRKWEPDKISKVMRYDYVALTINRAKSGRINSTSEKNLIVAAVAADVDPPNKNTDDVRAKLDHLGLVFGGLDIDAIVGYGREDTSYYIKCRGGIESIAIGKDSHLRDYTSIRLAILKATNGQNMMNRLKEPAWMEILRIFFSVLIIEDIPENTIRGKFDSWLDLFLSEKRIYQGEELEIGFTNRQPIYKSNQLWVNASVFNAFIEARFMEKIKRNDLSLAFKLNGFKPINKALRINTTTVRHQRYWVKDWIIDNNSLEVEQCDEIQEIQPAEIQVEKPKES